MRLGTALIAAAIIGGGLAAPARAADMPLYGPAAGSGYAPADPQLEFGSGWYLRGDAAFGPEDKPKLQVLGTAASFDRAASALGYGLGVGMGYKFSGWFRADVTGDLLDPFHYKAIVPDGAGNYFERETDVWRWAGLVNGYVDLGEWAGFTPYVGAGAGVSGTHQNGSIAENGAPLSPGILDPRTGRLVTHDVGTRTDYRFAWAAMAGVSYAVTPNMLLDIGYRYLDLGKTTIPLFPADGVTRTLTSQQARVGLRYVID